MEPIPKGNLPRFHNKSLRNLVENMHSSLPSLPKINDPQSSLIRNHKISIPDQDYKKHDHSNSLNNIKSGLEKPKSISPKRLPPLLPKLKDSAYPFGSRTPGRNDEVVRLDKFMVHQVKRPEFSLPKADKSATETGENKLPMKKSIFSCPFAHSSLMTDSYKGLKEVKDPFPANSSPLNPNQVPDTKALESLWNLFSSQNFSYIILDFEQKVLKVPQLAKFFQNTDTSKIFQGKLDFFKRNIGKRDMSMHNRVLLETIHKKMKISNDDFNVFKGFFSIVMREHLVDEELIADFLRFLENFRRNIVTEESAFQKASKEIFDFESQLIEKFMSKINSNQLLVSYFSDKDISFQRNHCKAVISYLLKEDQSSYDQELRNFHKNCVIEDHNFFYFKQCLLQSLREFQRETVFSTHPNKREALLTPNDIWMIGDTLEEARLAVMNQKSYYEIINEKYGMGEVAKVMMSKIQKNTLMESLFGKCSEEKLRKHTELILKFVLGGFTKYAKSDITPAHYNLEITLEHFHQLRSILDQTLTFFKLEYEDRNYILAVLDSCKYEICNVKPLLNRIGGSKTIDYVINSFYLKAYQHNDLSGYFKNTEIKVMIQNQKFWFAKFFENSGMKPYHFKDLRTFHLGMGITKQAFEYFVKNMLEGLKEFGYHNEEILREATNWLVRVKADILDLKNEGN